MLTFEYRIHVYGNLSNCIWWLPCSIEMRVKCLFILPTEHTRYEDIVVYVMCLYLDMALKRYGYLKVLSTLGNSPAVLHHLLYFYFLTIKYYLVTLGNPK